MKMSANTALTRLRWLSKEIEIELKELASKPKGNNTDELLEEIEDLISVLETYQGFCW